MLTVALLTVGTGDQLTGGHLFHRRMVEAAPRHDARLGLVPVGRWRAPAAAGDRPDVVLIDSLAATRVALDPRCRRLGRASGSEPRWPGAVPLAAVLHQPPGGVDGGPLRRWAQAPLDRSLYRRCRLLLAASAALRDEVVHRHGLPPERVVVVPPGCDVASRPRRATGPDLRRGRRVALLSVANWAPHKGVLDLLAALARLPDGDATLHLAGRDDVEARYTRRVRARLAAPDLTGRVVVHGPLARERVAALYAGADVFVLPSYRESYGTVYGEALAAGLPVVGWRAGNLPHLATDGVEGVLVAPGDVAGLAAVLARLARDDGWRSRLAAGARGRGATLPRWDDTAAAFFGALRDLAGDSG